jgi:uncharacterized protein with HEPN domain
VTPEELLAGLARELDQIAKLVERGRGEWESDDLLRLAIERRWINAGNYAEGYRIVMGRDPGTEPWSELYDFRCLLAHALPEQIDSDRIWYDTTQDLSRIREAVQAARS